jgi:dolichol-phosphate mannosyltransferase
MQNKSTLIVVASYNEIYALPAFLSELAPLLTKNETIVVADDSPIEKREQIKGSCESSFKLSEAKIDFSFSNSKNGRGAAIHRGFKFAIQKYGNFDYFIECDSDGSHTPKDIVSLINSTELSDLIIGSRYLPLSRIIGWPRSRRVFSKILNALIPKLVGIKCSDITNGLRRYSANAVSALLKYEPRNKGFIYLSEQAIILNNRGFSISEFPITFVNRILGESTVGMKELFNSITGIAKLIGQKNI